MGDALVCGAPAQCATGARAAGPSGIATIYYIREQVNLQDSAVKMPSSPTRLPIGCSTPTCRKVFAKSFRLYKLYARAASFAAFAEE